MFIVRNEFIKAIYLSLTFFMSSFFSRQENKLKLLTLEQFLGQCLLLVILFKKNLLKWYFYFIVTNGLFWYIQYSVLIHFIKVDMLFSKVAWQVSILVGKF